MPASVDGYGDDYDFDQDSDVTVGGLLDVVELQRAGLQFATAEQTEEAVAVAEPPHGLALFAPDDAVSCGAALEGDVARKECREAPCGSQTLTVQDVMTPRPTCIAAEATLLQIVRLVHAKKFRHLLVADDDGRLIGVVSDRDIVRCFGPGDFPEDAVLEKVRAADVMSSDVVTAGPFDSPADCIDKMQRHGINCLPVVVDRRPIGILTTADLLRLLRLLLAN
ncbi:MAG: CBS domain-containing protein [Pirellulales bacterium]